MNKNSAVILIGHGSPLRGFQAPMKKVVAKLKKSGDFSLVLCAYLKGTSPAIEDAIEVCVEKNAKTVYLVPYFLLIGNHVKFDIPYIVSLMQKKYRAKTKIILCPYLGYDDKLVDVVRKRIKGAL